MMKSNLEKYLETFVFEGEPIDPKFIQVLPEAIATAEDRIRRELDKLRVATDEDADVV